MFYVHHYHNFYFEKGRGDLLTHGIHSDIQNRWILMDHHPPKICPKVAFEPSPKGWKSPKKLRPLHQTPVVFNQTWPQIRAKSIISGDVRSGISAQKTCHVMHSCRPKQFLNNSRFNNKKTWKHLFCSARSHRDSDFLKPQRRFRRDTKASN